MRKGARKGASPPQDHKDNYRAWTICHVRRGWESWDCSA